MEPRVIHTHILKLNQQPCETNNMNHCYNCKFLYRICKLILAFIFFNITSAVWLETCAFIRVIDK